MDFFLDPYDIIIRALLTSIMYLLVLFQNLLFFSDASMTTFGNSHAALQPKLYFVESLIFQIILDAMGL